MSDDSLLIPKLATIENMQAHWRPGVLAYSPGTEEEYSANPNDYWDVRPGWTMRDSDGEPMVLVSRVTSFLPIAGN